MAERKTWFCRWSSRTNKVFYVNIETRASTWIKPPGFVETQDELKKISEWTATTGDCDSTKIAGNKRKKSNESEEITTKVRKVEDICSLQSNETEEKTTKVKKVEDNFESTKISGNKRKKSNESEEKTTKVRKVEDNMIVSPENNNGIGDYIRRYSDKRNMVYYFNYKTKCSQWKKPACFLEAETEEAIKKANLKKKLVNLNTNRKENVNNNADDVIDTSSEDILAFSTLNAEALAFEKPSKLNAEAAPFVPRQLTITSTFQTKELTQKKKETNALPNNTARTRKVVLKRDKKEHRKSEPITTEPTNRVSVKERLSMSSGNLNKSVHDRLGTRKHDKPQTCLVHESDSDILISEQDLIYISTPPPNPETEIRRFSEVSYLRKYFAELCENELELEEPNEAFNRWLLEQKLTPADHVDPFFCYSDHDTVSLYRELMQDLPFKYKVGRQNKTCTGTLDNFAEHLKMLSVDWGEEDAISKKCDDVLKKNGSFSDTRKLISELRESCQEIIERNYKDRVIKLCDTMKEECKKSANRVLEFVKCSGFGEVVEPRQPRPVSTRHVRCRPATPLISSGGSRDQDVAVIVIEYPDTDNGAYKLTYKTRTLSINSSHYTKLEALYKSTSTTNSDETLFNSRVWCLLQRYEMLRSSIVVDNKIQSENFGLHAALPHAAFELLHERFGVTFECFASPFNCYFKQFCSAFPDIDCYFGSRGSFFEFKPKSGSFQANPPFSEEVMLAMAKHMIHLLGDTDKPLMFVVFIPNWAEPMTPAIPVLRDSEYCTNNILLDPKYHQYITGNQHLASVQLYDAVHGTQVYLLQNPPATQKWDITSRDMSELQHVMGRYNNNRQWN